MNLLGELKRRNVFRVAAAYVVLSWLVLQMGDLLFDLMGLPEWSLRIVLGILLLGFPVALVFSWVYELTPEGVKKESEIDRSRTITPETGRKLDYLTIGMIVVGIGVVALDRLIDSRSPVVAVPEVVQDVVRSAPDPIESSPVPQPTDSGQAGARGKSPIRSAPFDSGPSIAVLPFANLSPDRANEYFADGVAEEILNLIAKTPDLRVISRSSAFSFKGQNLPIPEVARRLGVNHILEGSVRRAGDRVRVTAQLIDVASDAHLWSETFDRQLDDIFAVQDEIAGAIADALQLELGLGGSETSSLEAYELVMKGRTRVSRRTREGIEEGVAMFTRAAELAPDYAEAFGQLAMSHILQHSWYARLEGTQALESARLRADQALDIDPDNVPALVAAAIHSYYKYEFDASEAMFRRALTINPNSVQANNWYGDFLTVVDRPSEAVVYETRAVQLDPLLAVHRDNLSAALILDGRIDEGLAEFEKVLELDPEYPLFNYGLRTMAIHGRKAQLERFLARVDVTGGEAGLLRALVEGDKPAAVAIADQMTFPSQGMHGGADYLRGVYLAALGEFDRAIDHIDADDLDAFGFAYDFPTDPEILQAHPRYADWWRQPPRDKLLRARGHWIWGEG